LMFCIYLYISEFFYVNSILCQEASDQPTELDWPNLPIQ
jgi:hypothetical protein